MSEGMIVNAFLAGKFASSGQAQSVVSQDGGFQAIMERTSDSSYVAQTDRGARTEDRGLNASVRAERDKNVKRKEPERSKERGNIDKPKVSREKSDDGKQSTDKVKNSEPAKKETEVRPTDSVDNEVESEIAKVLGITTEEVAQILTALNIQPTDLLDTQKLNQFIQTVYKAESPVDLLNVPDIGKVFADVKEIVENISELMPQLADVVDPDAAVITPVHEELVEVSENQAMPIETAVNTIETKSKDVFVNENPRVDEPDVTISGEVELPEVAVEAITTNMQSQDDSMGNAQENIDHPDFIQDVTIGLRDNVRTMGAVRVQQPTRTVSAQEIISQLIDRMRADVRTGVSEVRITLRPEYLGDVTLRIVTQNGSVTAQFVAESQRIKEVIESNFDKLRESLQAQGIDVTNLEVEVGQDSDQQQRMEEFLKAQQRTSHRIRDIINNMSEEEDDVIAETVDTLDNSSVNYTA